MSKITVQSLFEEFLSNASEGVVLTEEQRIRSKESFYAGVGFIMNTVAKKTTAPFNEELMETLIGFSEEIEEFFSIEEREIITFIEKTNEENIFMPIIGKA